MMSAIFATPRLPAVIATDCPGFTVWLRFSRDNSMATVLAICSTGRVGDSNDWRTRKVRGYCDIVVVEKVNGRFRPDYTHGSVSYRRAAGHQSGQRGFFGWRWK